MPTTVSVLTESTKMHPVYKKAYKVSRKFLVHDLIGVNVGDLVEIIKTRPISKNKHFQIHKVIGRDTQVLVEEKLKQDATSAIAQAIETKDETVEVVEEKPKRVRKVNK
jgi:small subunit ribosomal protein S17